MGDTGIGESAGLAQIQLVVIGDGLALGDQKHRVTVVLPGLQAVDPAVVISR
ncbi:hypothetical protein D3C83_151600 [compost metagenome]